MDYTNFLNEINKIPPNEWVVSESKYIHDILYTQFVYANDHIEIEIERQLHRIDEDVSLFINNEEHYLDPNGRQQQLLIDKLKSICENINNYQEECRLKQEELDNKIMQHMLDTFKYK